MNDHAPEIPPPEPEKPGSDGTQSASSVEESKQIIKSKSIGGLSPYPFSDALRDISELGVRGQSGMVLLYAVIKRLESDLDEAREERKKSHDEAQDWRSKYHAASVENAVLRERLGGEERIKLLQNILITLGGIVLGVAIPNLNGQSFGLAFSSVLLGLLLLVGGWLWPLRRKGGKQ